MIARLSTLSALLAAFGFETLLDAAPPMPSIYLGTRIIDNSYVEVVGLTYDYEREPRCTGTLIGPRLVLTAAHCVCNEVPTDVFVGNDPEPGAVGRADYYPVEDVRQASPCDEDIEGRDFALVALDRPVAGISPIGFASDADVHAAKAGIVVGYGAIDASGSQIDFGKRFALVPITSTDCAGQDAAKFGCLGGAEMVAGKRKSADTCSGDSGGPLLIQQSSAAGRQVFAIAGVTSRSVISAGSVCGDGGVYSRMNARAQNWISQARLSLHA